AATHASSATAAATGATQSGAKIAEYPAGGGPVHRRSPTSKVVAAEPAATAARTAEGAGEGEVPVVSVMVTRLVTGAGRARRPQVSTSRDPGRASRCSRTAQIGRASRRVSGT